MDDLFDKLGLYDFFNVIFVGGIFIIVFLVILYPEAYHYFCGILKSSYEKGICFFFISYLLGIIFQEIGKIIDRNFEKVKYKHFENFLNDDNDIIDYNTKRNVYKRSARDILERQQIDIDVTEKFFSKEQNKYVFTYCLYYVENKKRNAKIEKMRALYDMARGLKASFCVILTIIIADAYNFSKVNLTYYAYVFLAVLVIIILLKIRMIYLSKYFIRMVMGVYESCK